MPKVPNLTRRHNTFFIRIRVPKDLQEVIGSGEIKRTLNTKDYNIACNRIDLERAKIKAEFAEHRQRLKAQNENRDMLAGYSDHDLQMLSLRWLSEKEENIEKSTPSRKKLNLSPEEKRDYYHDLQHEAYLAEEEMRGNSQTEYNASIQNAAKFLKENNITHDRKSDTFYDLAHYTIHNQSVI